MLPSGTARSIPSTAGFPSKALNKPFASIAKPVTNCPLKLAAVVARPDEPRQALLAPAPAGKSGGARLLRVRNRARRCGAAGRGAAQGMARLRRAWRHAVDGRDR